MREYMKKKRADTEYRKKRKKLDTGNISKK